MTITGSWPSALRPFRQPRPPVATAAPDCLPPCGPAQTNVLRMKDTKLVYLLVKLVAGSDNKQAAFHALCTITIMSEVPSCQQDVIDAGGLRCLVSCVSCVSRFKVRCRFTCRAEHIGPAEFPSIARVYGHQAWVVQHLYLASSFKMQTP